MAKKQERFVRIHSENMGGEQIIVDKVTGVNYLFVTSGYAGGLTVLLDRDGKPVISPCPCRKMNKQNPAALRRGFPVNKSLKNQLHG